MISVCIATYNGEKYIQYQIKSILSQLNKDDELIISDDGSTDNTLSIIYSFIDDRISVFENSFSSPIKNFEFLIKQSKGDFIFLSDQDDIWSDSKLDEFMKAFIKDKKTLLVISDLAKINSKGEILSSTFFKKSFKSNMIFNLIKNNYIGCSLAFKKELKKYILPFPKGIGMHDWWIGLCAVIFSQVIYLDKQLTYYRIHGNNFTRKNKAGITKKITWRIWMGFNILKRYIVKKLLN